MPINTATFSGPADHVDLLLQVDREKEELEKKMADILDMSKPFKSAAKGILVLPSVDQQSSL